MCSVVFLPGCNFRCPYCHNHRLVTEPGAFADVALEEALARLEDFRGWLDGVCISGGEPTIHDGLARLIEAFRARSWPVKLDTNGSRPEVVQTLVASGLVDAVAVDVKAPLEAVPYRRNAGTGSAPAAVRETLGILANAGIPVEVRTTVHPALLSQEELLRLASQVGQILKGRARFTPQRCRVDETLDPGLRALPPLTPEDFEGWAATAAEAFAEHRSPRSDP